MVEGAIADEVDPPPAQIDKILDHVFYSGGIQYFLYAFLGNQNCRFYNYKIAILLQDKKFYRLRGEIHIANIVGLASQYNRHRIGSLRGRYVL